MIKNLIWFLLARMIYYIPEIVVAVGGVMIYAAGSASIFHIEMGTRIPDYVFYLVIIGLLILGIACMLLRIKRRLRKIVRHKDDE